MRQNQNQERMRDGPQLSLVGVAQRLITFSVGISVSISARVDSIPAEFGRKMPVHRHVGAPHRERQNRGETRVGRWGDRASATRQFRKPCNPKWTEPGNE